MKYPNLELIEYKCKDTAYELYPELLKDAIYPSFRVNVFPQMWANTAIGFDMNGGVSGQAFTEAYTTVVKMTWYNKTDDRHYRKSDDEIYGVFFGNDIAYMFLNPNEQFFKDLQNNQMASQRNARYS